MLLRASVRIVTGLCGVAVLAAEPNQPVQAGVPAFKPPLPSGRGLLSNRIVAHSASEPVRAGGQCSIPLRNALKATTPPMSRMPSVKPPEEGFSMRHAVMPAPPCAEARR